MNSTRPGPPESTGRYRRWSFGTAVLDERTLELAVRGDAVAIERKPLELLLFLLQHADELVTKSEIIEAVWPGRILTESVLSKTVSKLREALQDDAQAIIRTLHGHGYRLVADVRVEVSSAPAPALLGFRPGDRLELRPLWGLIEPLGVGGQGEVWLAQHDKTGERRVFKFARDPAALTALTALKREITFYRLLHDSLGEAAAIVPFLDWNLAEPPYFLEAAHCGTDLVVWADAQGGLLRIPLSTRLEIAAQIAEAMTAAHSVGVLHKDLKPANVLVEGADAAPRIRLSDFGSGGLLDLQQLERLGITRLGLTQDHASGDSGAGTLSYLPPEVLAGQPFTVKADLYALGVILYELVAGSFRKPFAPGWELDVEDPLLREDIAAACAGDPAKRLVDAALLAERLRTLDLRRRQRLEAQAQRQRTERSERLRQELKRWRFAAAALLALALTALAAGGYAYRSRQQALAAADTTQAVTDFLVQDLLAGANPFKLPARDLSLRDVLTRAALKVDAHLAGRPEAARRVHIALSAALSAVWETEAALHHGYRYAELTAQTLGSDSPEYLGALNWIKYHLIQLGRMDDACRVADRIAKRMPAEGWRSPLARAVQRMDVLGCRVVHGDTTGFDTQASVLMRDIEAGRPQTTEAIWQAHPMLARYHWWGLGELPAAIATHRRLVALATEEFGEQHLITALQRLELGGSLSAFGDFEAAEQELARAESEVRAWMGTSEEASAQTARFTLPFRAMHRLNQGRFAEAEALALANRAHTPATERRMSDAEWVSDWLLAETHQLRGRCDLALAVTNRALASPTQLDAHWYAYSLRMPVHQVAADCLRERGDLVAARAVLDAIPAAVIDRYPPNSPFLAFFLRARGLLQAAEGRSEAARTDLQRVVAILEPLDPGRRSWRLRRAQEELAEAPAVPRR